MLTKRNYLSFWHQPRPLINKAAPMGAHRDCSLCPKTIFPLGCVGLRDVDRTVSVVNGWLLCAVVDGAVVCICCNKNLNCHFFFSVFVSIGLENVSRGMTAEYWALKREPPLPQRTFFRCAWLATPHPTKQTCRPPIHLTFVYPFFRLVFPTFSNRNSQRRSWLCTTVAFTLMQKHNNEPHNPTALHKWLLVPVLPFSLSLSFCSSVSLVTKLKPGFASTLVK